MKSINLNYVRGLYDSLFDKSDEELEGFNINSFENQKILFEEMNRKFSGSGPISKKNIIDGLNLIFKNASDEKFWRSAIPHDLPLALVADRKGYLGGIIFALTGSAPNLDDEWEFFLVDEIGSCGLDFSN
jgi:hypothetical protein